MPSFLPKQLCIPALLLAMAAACSPGPPNRAADTTAAPPATPPAAAAHDMAGMSMTGDADHDFLRMMSSHHKGLISLAHESMLKGSRGTPQSQEDAQILDARQDREFEQMISMLQAHFHDSTQPAVTPDDQATLDSVLRIPGADYAPAFYRTVVSQHRLAVTMIDDYLPRAGQPDIKALAERMLQEHLAEIKQFERKAK